MIHSKDRSGWFGASDTAIICGNWNTKTFKQWWLIKLGISQSNFESLQMKTGTAYEHRILKTIGVTKLDRQIRIRSLRLRVNLDGESRKLVHEVKTYGGEKFRVSKPYWQQAQVEMFATGKELEIVSYRLLPEDYKNWFLPIDQGRIGRIGIDYDSTWISDTYLPRLLVLRDCLIYRKWPEVRYVRGQET